MQRLKLSSPPLYLLILCSLLDACTQAAKEARYTKKAEEYFQAGQYDQAKIEFMNALRLNGNNAKAYARLGAIWLEEGAPVHAGSFLSKAIELTPDDLASHLALARAYLGLGRTAEAAKEAQTVLAKAPDNGDALLILTDAVQKKSNLDVVEQQLQKFPKKDSAQYQLALAGLAGRKGDLAGATAALRRAETIDPKLPAVHSALGVLAAARRDIAEATSELQKAADLSPVRSADRVSLAQLKFQTGAQAEGTAILAELTKKAPDFFPAWGLLAKIANQEKKPDEALAYLQNVLTRDPANIDARLVQAESWLAKGDGKKAVDSLEDLDREYQNVPLIKYALARAYLGASNVSAAMAELDQVIRSSPRFAEAVLLRSELQLRSGNAASAVDPLSALVKERPDLPTAPLLLAEAERSLGRLDEAAAITQEQIKRTPQVAPSYVLLGLILRQQHKPTEARQALEKAAELAPDNANIVEQLVEIDAEAQNFAAAEQRVDQALQKQPNSAAAHYLKGKLAFAQSKFDVAQTELLKSIQLDTGLGRAYDLLIPTYQRANQLPQVQAQMNEILAKNPNDVRALFLSGLIADAMKDYPRARDAYEKVIALQPNLAPALNNLAYIYSEKLPQLDRAAELARKARATSPTDPSIADTLGWVVYKQGDYQQAADLFGQSATKLGDSPEIQFHLGMANYMLGRTDVARTALRKAVDAPADFAGKDQARARLALLDDPKGNSPKISSAQLEDLVKQQPDDPVALVRLGRAYESEGNPAKAASTYERAFKASPKLVDAVVALARLNAGPLHNKESAIAYAKKARELSKDPRLGAVLGKVAFDAGNLPWSYSLLQESASALNGDNAVQHDLAWTTYGLGRTEEARQTMQRLTATNTPEGEDAKRFLSLTNLPAPDRNNGSWESEVKQILAQTPDYVPAIMAEAALQMNRNDLNGATASYEKALQRFPDFAPALKGLAGILATQPSQQDKAFDLATKARKTLTNDGDLLRILGRISFARKDYRRAGQFLQQLPDKTPLDPQDLFFLGMSKCLNGQKREGREALTRALQLGLTEPAASKAKQCLDDKEPGSPAQ